MKRKVFSLILCACLMLGALALPVSAYNRPAGSAAESGVAALAADTVAPDMSRNLTKGLTSSKAYSAMNAGTSSWADQANNLTAEEKADVADMSKHSFTVIGARSLERQADAAIDNVWTTGASGVNGAFSARWDGLYYNVNGETEKSDSIYKMMLTFDFGYICELDGIGFTHHYSGPYGLFGACDLFVSDDGVSWTPVGYWDYPQKRLDTATDFTRLNSNLLGKDAKGAVLDGKMYVPFAFPEGTQGKYLRIAATALECISSGNCKDQTNYEAWTFADTITFREMFVFGEAADVNYVGAQERTYTEGDVAKYDVRFLASMDDYKQYSEAGFRIAATYEKGAYAATGKSYVDACDYVYTALTAADGEGNIKAVAATAYHAGQMMALTIKGIPTDTGRVSFVVTPYYVLKGEAQTVSAQSYEVIYENGVYVSSAPCATPAA